MNHHSLALAATSRPEVQKLKAIGITGLIPARSQKTTFVILSEAQNPLDRPPAMVALESSLRC